MSKEIVMDLKHQQEGNYDATPALWRLLAITAKGNPLGIPIFAANAIVS